MTKLFDNVLETFNEISKGLDEALNNVDKSEIYDSVKEEYSKLTDIDKKDVVESANNIIDTFGKVLGMDTSKYHVTDEMLSAGEEKCKEAKDICKDTCSKVSAKISENISKEDAVNMVNDTIKSVFNTFGIKDADKYTIKNDDNVYVKVATPGNGIELTSCSADKKDGCYNESCDNCDGKCKNSNCDVEGCDCRDIEDEDFADVDADNEIDAPKTPTERVKLNLASPKKEVNKTKDDEYKHLAPEMRNPSASVRKLKDVNGDTWEGANPYNVNNHTKSKDSSYYMPKTNTTSIKSRLMKEATVNKVDDTPTMEVFKSAMVSKVSSILKDSETHSYTIHQKTEKSPAAVEVVLEDVNPFVKDNVSILAAIENELKEMYDFPEVHITVVDDNDYVNLVIFMVLE